MQAWIQKLHIDFQLIQNNVRQHQHAGSTSSPFQLVGPKQRPRLKLLRVFELRGQGAADTEAKAPVQSDKCSLNTRLPGPLP